MPVGHQVTTASTWGHNNLAGFPRFDRKVFTQGILHLKKHPSAGEFATRHSCYSTACPRHHTPCSRPKSFQIAVCKLLLRSLMRVSRYTLRSSDNARANPPVRPVLRPEKPRSSRPVIEWFSASISFHKDTILCRRQLFRVTLG